MTKISKTTETTNNANLVKTARLSGHNYSAAAPWVHENPLETPRYRGAIKCVRTLDWSDTVIVRNNWEKTDLDPRKYYNEDDTLNTEEVVAFFRKDPIHRDISTQKAIEKWLSTFSTAAYVTEEMEDAAEARRLADKVVAEAGL